MHVGNPVRALLAEITAPDPTPLVKARRVFLVWSAIRSETLPEALISHGAIHEL